MTSDVKRIYFVRHGESEGNLGIVRQGVDAPLTEEGKRQAGIIAERCTRLPIEVIIASTMTRAQETAEMINKATGIAMESSDLFVERRRPSIQNGKKYDDADAASIDKEIFANFAASHWRHSDEENFDDLKQRALDMLAYLEARHEHHIAVVTHGWFMRIVLAVITFGESLNGEMCEQFLRTFDMSNTGLTIAEHTGDKVALHPWRIRVWNDHTHLG